MFEVRIEGFDDLSRELRDAQETLKGFHGELGEVRFDPYDSADVQRAIAKSNRRPRRFFVGGQSYETSKIALN